MLANLELEWWLGIGYLLLETAAIASAVHAVMLARTAQGATAWAISLVTFPLLSLPLYLVLGRSKFQGYVKARRVGNRELAHVIRSIRNNSPRDFRSRLDGACESFQALEGLAHMPFTRANAATLLVNGEATFDAIFAAIDRARRYILVQFYIVRDDDLGRALRSRLVQRLHQGIAVHFLYDEIGSYGLPRAYLRGLEESGAEVSAFNSTRGRTNRLQINFRNHRKIVIIDGEEAYVGGHNVGDEYLGLDPGLSPWRDTHVAILGPAVLGIQLSFLEDWYWATERIAELNWTPRGVSTQDIAALAIPSGPADSLDTCGLFFVHSIHSARRRLWIVSPYFVPDQAVISALQLAVLRGVDVRILLPRKADHWLVNLAGYSYLPETAGAGVKVYRHKAGFLHQKVMLIDDEIAAIGTANLDNRSFRLNFELTVVLRDRRFAGEVETMLRDDFAGAQPVSVAEFAERSLWFRSSVRLARLFAPIL